MALSTRLTGVLDSNVTEAVSEAGLQFRKKRKKVLL